MSARNRYRWNLLGASLFGANCLTFIKAVFSHDFTMSILAGIAISIIIISLWGCTRGEE